MLRARPGRWQAYVFLAGCCWCCCYSGSLSPSARAAEAAPGKDLNPDMQAIRSVGLEGRGSPEATAAWAKLAACPPDQIVGLIQAMDGSNPLADNWLRSAVETISDRARKAGTALPMEALGAFLLDTQRPAKARRLAFEVFAAGDPASADKLLAGMISDPCPELRRDAVQKLVDAASRTMEAGNRAGARVMFQQALGFANEVSQIDQIVKQLRSLGQTVDLASTLGFVLPWQVVGPFDNVGGKGFAAVFAPESDGDRQHGADSTREYDGKSGKVKWVPFTSTDEYGVISMNKPLTAMKGVAAYAVSEFYSPVDQEVELRLGSENAWKLWLNGEYLFGQDEYHRNKAIDQYRMKGRLKAGKNLILVKVCQNEQTEDWAGDWDYQLRICDRSGNPVRSTPPTGAAGVNGGKP